MHASVTSSVVRHAVCPVAGLGTRFLPATKAQPKEMLPLVDRPVIQYVVEEAIASGIHHVTLVTGRGKDAIEDHFDAAPELERLLERRGDTARLEAVRAISELVSFSYVRQREALGLGHAVLTARELVGDEPFAVFLGDDVIHAEVPCMAQLLEVHARRGGCVIAVEEVAREQVSAYGVVDAREVEDGIFEVRDLVEKPAVDEAPSRLAIIGRYVLDPKIFAHLARTEPDARGEIQLTNGLRALCGEVPVHAVRFAGTRYDTGNKLGFLKATVEFALRRTDLGPQFEAYLRALNLDDLARDR
ncbi:MAG: UTP--glucose-1-phosphate uridylyltransferase GalU [Acidobacteriota bacterium]